MIPQDIDTEVLYDLERAVDFASKMSCRLEIEYIETVWMDLVVGQAIKSETMAEADCFIDNYLSEMTNGQMEPVIISMLKFLNIAAEHSDFKLILNSPQTSLFGMGLFVADEYYNYSAPPIRGVTKYEYND